MDKKSIIGLVLIGLILSVFTIVNQPTAEERALQAKQEAKKIEQLDEVKKDEVLSEIEKKKTDKPVPTSKNSSIQKEVFHRIENSKLIVDLSSKGGKIAAVYLKEFKTYKDFKKKDSKNAPLLLFANGDAVNELNFPVNGADFKTGKLDFAIAKSSKNAVVFEHVTEDGQLVRFSYKLNNDAYDLDYKVALKGFEKVTSAKNIQLDWTASLRKTERLFNLKEWFLLFATCKKKKD